MNDIDKLFQGLTTRADATGKSIDDVNAAITFVKANAVPLFVAVFVTLVLANLIALTIYKK